VTYRLTIAYDGTGLVGWQRQASGTSIQGLLEDALSELDGRPARVTGAGRTDAGVHAHGQVASVTLERGLAPDALMRAVNARLPAAVRVMAAVEAPADFHARFGARAKRYRYRIWYGEVISPFERAYAWHVRAPALDTTAMAEAAALVAGTHDFAAFQAAGSDVASTVRTVTTSIIAADPPLVTYDIAGDGFLRHMVRGLVGTLVEVGRGRWPPSRMREVIASRDRALAGASAPPEGLFLVAVS
jgi:tRNA pseudouridine38-40 synthase